MRYYKDIYFLGDMSEAIADKLIALHDISVVESLKHSIYDLPEHKITEIIREVDSKIAEANGVMTDLSVRSVDTTLPRGTLADYQTVGVAFAFYAKRFILGDSVGLGKTVQIAGLMNLLSDKYAKHGRNFRLLFLGEKTPVAQLRAKLVRFTGRYVGVLESGEAAVVDKFVKTFPQGTPYSFTGSHSLLNSSTFLNYCNKYPFDAIVIDESSILKNRKTDITKNAEALLQLSPYAIFLNATPVEKKLEEFYQQLRLLDKTGVPTLSGLRSMYCKMGYGVQEHKIVGYKNEAHFRKAVSLRYLARTRSVLGARIENNRFQVLNVPMSKEQKRLVSKTSLYQMLGDYPTGVDRRVPFNVETTPKLQYLLDLVNAIDVSINKILIYCHFVDGQKHLMEALENEGYSCAILNGRVTSAKKRDAIISDFNNDVYSVLITNVKKGIDILGCDYAIFYTIDDNPQTMVQTEGRITREFDIIGKNVYLLVSEGKERKKFDERLALEADAAANFATADKSLVLEALRRNKVKATPSASELESQELSRLATEAYTEAMESE